jgi:integrase
MSRPRRPIGTFGSIAFTTPSAGLVLARTRQRDWDGRLRLVQASGPTKRAAERALKEKLTKRTIMSASAGEISADSSFPKLVELWLRDLDLEGRIALSTRELYEREMRALVLPEFEHLTLREITVSRVDQFLKRMAKRSYSRAKQSKVVLGLALGLAVRYEAITRNPVLSASRLRKPESSPRSLTKDEIDSIRAAIRQWRAGPHVHGPRPDGQIGAIIEVMLGTSARIGEVLAIRKCDVDMTAQPGTVRIDGTIISPKGLPTFRQDHPKSAKSRRTIAVPSFTAEVIRRRLVEVADASDDGLLFLSRNGTPLTTNNVRRQLRAILDKAGISGVTPHSFRRTVATTIDRQGGTELAAELLGHSSSGITIEHYIEKRDFVNPVTAAMLEGLGPHVSDEGNAQIS